MDKGKRNSPPPSSASASSKNKNAAASSLNSQKSASASSKTKNDAASLSSPKSASTSSKTKNDASSLSSSKRASASSKDKKAAASPNAPNTVERKRKDINTQEDEDEMPEVITNETAYKMMRIEEKRIRDSVPKNPYRCPDMNAKNWTDKDRKDYKNWLIYKKGHLGLTLVEEEHLITLGVDQPSNSKTYLD